VIFLTRKIQTDHLPQCRSTKQNIAQLGPSSKPSFQNQPTGSFLADLLTLYQAYRLYGNKQMVWWE